jgi:AcrR family transcriptional regulator
MTKAERTRQLIIEQSAPIFNTKGIAGTAMSDIMEATKLAKGSLYVHFENKEELSYAAVDYNLYSLFQKVMAIFSKGKTAKDKLFGYLDLFADPINPPVTGGCPVINFGMEADDTNPVIKQKANNGIKLILKNVALVIEEGIKAGEFKPTWDANEFALKMFALTEGGIMVSLVAGNNIQMKAINRMIKKEIEEQLI